MAQIKTTLNPDIQAGTVPTQAVPSTTAIVASGIQDVATGILSDISKTRQAENQLLLSDKLQRQRMSLEDQLKQSEERRAATQYDNLMGHALSAGNSFNQQLKENPDATPAEIEQLSADTKLSLLANLIAPGQADDMSLSEKQATMTQAMAVLTAQNPLMRTLGEGGVTVTNNLTGEVSHASARSRTEEILDRLSVNHPEAMLKISEAREAGDEETANVLTQNLLAYSSTMDEIEERNNKAIMLINEAKVGGIGTSSEEAKLQQSVFADTITATTEGFNDLFSKVIDNSTTGKIAAGVLKSEYHKRVSESAILAGMKPTEREPLAKYVEAKTELLLAVDQVARGTYEMEVLKSHSLALDYAVKVGMSDEERALLIKGARMESIAMAYSTLNALSSAGALPISLERVRMYNDKSAAGAAKYSREIIEPLNRAFDREDEKQVGRIEDIIGSGLDLVAADMQSFITVEGGELVPNKQMKDFMITVDGMFSSDAFQYKLETDKDFRNSLLTDVIPKWQNLMRHQTDAAFFGGATFGIEDIAGRVTKQLGIDPFVSLRAQILTLNKKQVTNAE